MSALRLEAPPFTLKGRDYEPRTTLKPHIVRILDGLELPYASVKQGTSVRHYYPLRLVNRAAQVMGVEPSQFTSTINLASRQRTYQQVDEELTARLFY